MTDAQKVDRIRECLRELARKKNEQHATGATFVLYDAASVIDTFTGYIDGADRGGAQDDDTTSVKITNAMKLGASVSIVAVGYQPAKVGRRGISD